MKTLTPLTVLLYFSFFGADTFAQVDYEKDIQPIFDASCVSCHGSTSGVNLANYDAVMNSVGDQYGTEIVVPGNPNQSPLVDKIEPSPEIGSRMPQGGPFLSNDEIDLIRNWIAEGANEVAVSNEMISEVPEGFEMIDNYPNPFNPQTTISFTSPVTSAYNLNVYNATGVLIREFSGVTNNPKTQVQVNMNDLPSGIYIYRVKITSGNRSFFLESQKMTLTK